MSERFVGVDAKIERAKEHISQLEVAIRDFFKSDPYEVMSYKETGTGDRVWFVRVHNDPPLRIGTIVGDAISNLRAALDYLICELCEINGQPVTNDLYFPIAWNAQQYGTKLTGIEKAIGHESVDLLRPIEAYKGGNGHCLWQLHQLGRSDKHRVPIPIGSAHKNIILDFASVMRRAGPKWEGLPAMDVAINPANRIYPLKDRAMIFRVSSGVDPSHVDMNPKFTFEVAFGEGEVVKGEPILETAQKLHEFVSGVAEPFRLLQLAHG